MNTFNRVVLVILLLAVMVLCSFVFVVPVQALRVLAQQAGIVADFFARVRPVVRLGVGILLALIVDLVGILLIILEVRRPAARSISVEQASGGEVTLSIASIADQVKAEVNQLPEVLQAKPKVTAKRKGVVVELDAKIAAEAGVPGKAEKIVETVRHVVEEKMGLKLARVPKVNIEAVRQAPGTRVAKPSAAPAEESESDAASGTESTSF
jgi:hypothetical protein